ncbi:hypothetical protein HBI44_076710 [Parastagonospora nodorum]|nr:hypothetical protein HBH52_047620 [Parastagonospora nodorum]KAH5698556.1 hypothetical protein HBI44_076710 [Parastagonospora nodorum]
MGFHDSHISLAAALTQKLFFQFGEMNFVFQPTGIEEKNGELLIHVYLPPEGKYIKFKPDVVMTEQQKSMVVSHLACSSAAIYFKDLLAKFLKGTNTRVGVTTLSLTPTGTITQYADPKMNDLHGRCHNHTLFKIFEENEPDEPDNPDRPAMWFIDLSGPQFSIFNPCLKPDIYRTTYKTSKPVDSTSDLKAGAQKLVPALEFGMTKRIVEDIENAIEEWERTKEVGIAELLANGKYELFETDLLGFVEEKMKELREEVDWTARFKERDRLKAEGRGS